MRGGEGKGKQSPSSSTLESFFGSSQPSVCLITQDRGRPFEGLFNVRLIRPLCRIKKIQLFSTTEQCLLQRTSQDQAVQAEEASNLCTWNKIEKNGVTTLAKLDFWLLKSSLSVNTRPTVVGRLKKHQLVWLGLVLYTKLDSKNASLITHDRLLRIKMISITQFIL